MSDTTTLEEQNQRSGGSSPKSSTQAQLFLYECHTLNRTLVVPAPVCLRHTLTRGCRSGCKATPSSSSSSSSSSDPRAPGNTAAEEVCVAVSSSSAPLPSVSESWRAAVFVQDVQSVFLVGGFGSRRRGLCQGVVGQLQGGRVLTRGRLDRWVHEATQPRGAGRRLLLDRSNYWKQEVGKQEAGASLIVMRFK